MAFLLVITRGWFENQWVAIPVQWVTWVFGRWKKSPLQKQIREGEFLFCEGTKVGKLEEEIWKHQQLLKILLQVLGWTNISKNNHSKTWLRVFKIVFLPSKQWWRFLKNNPRKIWQPLYRCGIFVIGSKNKQNEESDKFFLTSSHCLLTFAYNSRHCALTTSYICNHKPKQKHLWTTR